MMRTLDDVLFGLFIFFAVDRFVRLMSNSVIEPFVKRRTTDKNVIENWKLFSEFMLLAAACITVFVYRKPLEKLVT